MRSFERLRAALGPGAAQLRFAMNAGMYDEAGQPIGLYVERGRQLHRLNLASGNGNFTMKPNGVFAVSDDGRVEIATSDAWRERPREVRWATQSGPMLVIAGHLHPLIRPNGPSLNLRNGVGVDAADSAWFVISDDPVSFGRFARFFRDSLGCRDSLFFDGAVSSLWDPGAGRMDQRAELGPMILVFRRD